MSVATPTVAPVFHPWRWLRSLSHIELRAHDGGDLGETDFVSEISLRRGLTQAERRSTVAHELVHIDRGPCLDEPALVAREELRVRRAAARLLLPDIHLVGEALAWARDTAEAADELWVDEDTLIDRLENLHPAELHYLRGRLAEVGQ